MSGEEVRIVAVLDDKDIVNGVKRVENAAHRMKQAVEEGLVPSGGIAEDAGAKAAQQFSNSFIKRLVIRDAIYGLLRGLTNVAADLGQDIAAAFGAKLPKEGFLAGFEKWIADGIFNIIESVSPTLRNADHATRERNIAQIKEDEERRFRNELYKEDPRTFAQSSAQVNDNINRLNQGLTDAKIANQRFHELEARFRAGDENEAPDVESLSDKNGTFVGRKGANVSDSLLALMEEDTKKRLKQADFELQIAREKEHMLKAEQHKEETAKTKEEHKRLADEKKAKAAEDKATRHEAAVKKNRAQHALAEERAEISMKGPHADLRETERLLGHQRATSAVMINGGLFGRNDSALALVQHASQQVSILRSIDTEIKHIRKERSDLTLL